MDAEYTQDRNFIAGTGVRNPKRRFGRTTKNEDTGTLSWLPYPKEPKWQLPPKFQKQQVLFNAHRVWGSLHVVLVEGFFDAIHLQSLGIPAVACMGTAVSEAQADLLVSLGMRRVTVLFDGDAEGQAAAERAAPVLAAKLFTRIGSLPVGCDPDEAPEELLREVARCVL